MTHTPKTLLPLIDVASPIHYERKRTSQDPIFEYVPPDVFSSALKLKSIDYVSHLLASYVTPDLAHLPFWKTPESLQHCLDPSPPFGIPDFPKDKLELDLATWAVRHYSHHVGAQDAQTNKETLVALISAPFVDWQAVSELCEAPMATLRKRYERNKGAHLEAIADILLAPVRPKRDLSQYREAIAKEFGSCRVDNKRLAVWVCRLRKDDCPNILAGVLEKYRRNVARLAQPDNV